ncbi:YIP1 family protein [bacterium]|nr:YIP1 family protein [bacterium]
MAIHSESMKKRLKDVYRRVRDILFNPLDAWTTIRNEDTSITGIFKETLLILMAVPALSRFLGWGILGIGSHFGRAVTWYSIMLLGLWGISKLVTYLAPNFGTEVDDLSGFKLVVYSAAPFLASGVFFLIPILGVLTLAGMLYSLYVLFIGIPVMTGVPKDKAFPFTILVAAAFVVLVFAAGLLGGGVFYPSRH